MPSPPLIQSLYTQIADLVRPRNVFDSLQSTATELTCIAKVPESQAFYLVNADPAGEKIWVGLYTTDRWLSESIEADLMHVGDHVEDLLEEELADQGVDTRLPVEHFRDDSKRYVFRSPVTPPKNQKLDSPAFADLAAKVLLAYEATFRQLGDMQQRQEED